MVHFCQAALDISASATLRLTRFDGSIVELPRVGDDLRWEAEGIAVTMESSNLEGGLLLRPEVHTNETLAIADLTLIDVPIAAEEIRFLRFGFMSPGDPCFFGRLGPQGITPEPAGVYRNRVEEDERQVAVTSTSAVALADVERTRVQVIGNSTFKHSEGSIYLVCEKATGGIRLIYKVILDGMILPAGESKSLDPLVSLAGTDLHELLVEWADHAAAQVEPLMPKAIPTGWNDWQYYRNEKTQEDVLDSTEVIADLKRRGYPLDFMQIDGGFCLHLSEWSTPKPEFADGIDSISQKIRDQGLQFGLWFAPYIQNRETSVVKEHPEWLLRDGDGEPVAMPGSNVGPAHLIDYSLDGPLDWLREQVRLFVQDWHVTWIKLDGPQYHFYRRGLLQNRSMSVHEMLIRTFEVIRDEAGPEVLVEGEGMLGLALGRVELHRMQQDTHPLWYRHSVEERPAAYAPYVYGKELIMGFLHNRWWCNHRENVILRDFPSPFAFEGGNNPYVYGPVFTDAEFKTQLVAAVMGSGGILLTDPMKELARSPERMRWISRILPVWPHAARVVDFFPDGRYPHVYRLDVETESETYTLIAVINWTDRMADFSYPMAELVPAERAGHPHHAFSYLDQGYAGIARDCLEISNLAAHASCLVALRPVQDHPQLISTSMHFVQGAVELERVLWRTDTDCLTIEVRHFCQEDEKLFLTVPEGWRLERIETDARRYVYDDFDRSMPAVRFEGAEDGRTRFDIFWERR
jgi:hypothetical protein